LRDAQAKADPSRLSPSAIPPLLRDCRNRNLESTELDRFVYILRSDSDPDRHYLGHYEIHALLGAGGMGEVYRATDTSLGREIALKVLSAEMAADHDRLMRFHREARAAAALNHPNIVTLYSAEEIDGIHFFTMELVDGRPLDELIPAEGFPADRVVEFATPLAEAIAAAHNRGLVHRDLQACTALPPLADRHWHRRAHRAGPQSAL
jgi:serine/threonine protein kinase